MPERSVAFDLQFGEGRNLHAREWRAGRHALRREAEICGPHWPVLAALSKSTRAASFSVLCRYPNNDAATTNFAFGGPDNQSIYLEGATSGTFWRFKAPYPGLIGPGGVRLPAQP